MLLEFNPCLAKYSTFGGLNSPLHFAAAKGHNEIVSLLLESGADVNSRNYCGQTALMQACRHGHWEVVQTLLLSRCNVTRADYLTGRTALHFAAVDGHVRCIRLLVADYIPSAPYDVINPPTEAGGDATGSPSVPRFDRIALARFVNKPADGGITALHMAALSGFSDCVQLLLDLRASVSVVTFHYGSSMNLIGAGSTPLHYAACGGSLKCCQILISRGASRLALNCNGWLPHDVARMWGRHCLEPLLAPNSDSVIPMFPTSKYLCLPLMSILIIAREFGLQSSVTSNDSETCAVCLERGCTVAAEGCAHQLCVKCALYLCSTSNITSEMVGPPGSIPCPFCRTGIVAFIKLPSTPENELKPNPAISFCNPCILHPRARTPLSAMTTCRNELRRNRVAAVSSELVCPLSCSPFPSAALPSCSCDDDPCPAPEPEDEPREQSPRGSHATPNELQDKMEEHRLERTSCSGIFWNRRSCHREHQCNAEINA